MKKTMAVAKKELRSTFLSPVALIFLAAFLGASLLNFFWGQKFFSKNIADVRPFFRWMPYFLVVLVSAFTMRLWAEEFRSGTFEVLVTLPIRLRELVLGKFIAGLGLIGVALVLTLPVPISVAFLGDLDWGPVLGGYLGLLLLSGAYLALGMFVSSFTDNQIVALMFTVLACGFLALIGSPTMVESFGAAAGEFLRGIGAASRLESVLRGVIDLRDLIYYLSLVVFFLVLNVLVIESRRWGRSLPGASRRRNTKLGVALLGANLLMLNLGLSPLQALRVDLTEWREYSISDVTKRLIRGAREPLLVRGYFSDKTHPLLKPLVPRIADFLKELQAVGGPSLSTEFVDPTKDAEAEKEAHGTYGVRSAPFRFADRHQDSVVNAYFSILVRYGDQFEVLDLEDLIEVDVTGTDIQVRLRNLEYDLTRAIKKVVYGFKSIESVCSRMKGQAVLKVFVTPEALPTEFREVPGRVEKLASEIRDRCSGRFQFQVLNPDQPDSGVTRESLYTSYGIKPMLVSLLDEKTFYLHMVMEIGGDLEPLVPEGDMTEADIRKELVASLQRHAPGALKTVGLASGDKPRPPPYPGAPPPPGSSFRAVERRIAETYQVRQVDLSSGRVPGEVDVLFVLNPRDLGDQERYAIDQFLMRGGATIVAAGRYVFEPSPAGELEVTQAATGLEELLLGYGVEVGDSVVLDEENSPFPVPVVRNLGGLTIRELKLANYPPFVYVNGEGLDAENPATRTLPGVVMQWTSPIRCKKGDGAPDCRPLLQSSKKSWTAANFLAQPDYQSYPDLGFSAPERREVMPVAVAVQGSFKSFFAGKDAPVLEAEGGEPRGKAENEKKGRRGNVIEHSPDGTRLVVLGSMSFLEDTVLSIASQVSDAYQANLQFANNLVDWSLEDPALLKIRSKEQYARTLKVGVESERSFWEWVNYLFALLAVLAIGLVTLTRRRQAQPVIAAAGLERPRRERS